MRHRLSAEELLGSDGLAAVTENRLLLELLDAAPVCDIGLERLLTALRSVLLGMAAEAIVSAPVDGRAIAVAAALARQCFINEYVFTPGADEIAEAHWLKERVLAALDAGTATPALGVAAIAAYEPLHSLPGAERLLERSWPAPLDKLLTQQLREPLAERRIAAALARLTAIEDPVSRRVRAQYEDNPYPRWVQTARLGEEAGIEEHLRQVLPAASFRALGRGGALDILIAGCGTGREAIESALSFPAARLLAIDLSRASLSYAQRKTHELGLTHVEYAQADILELGGLGRSFDVIRASGVLHHLADPAAGWRALLALLRPHGFMRLGLYSALGRRNVVAARALIAARQWRSDADGIRRCRQAIMVEDAAPLIRTISRSPDFFSTSMCRDLLFHVEEHRLTLPEIGDFLAAEGLAFLGFDTHPQTVRAYRDRYPGDGSLTDLGLWHVYETENPEIFAGMYEFWVQKPGA